MPLPDEGVIAATGVGEGVIVAVGLGEGVIVAVGVGEVLIVAVGLGELLTSGKTDLPQAPIATLHSDNAASVGASRRARER